MPNGESNLNPDLKQSNLVEKLKTAILADDFNGTMQALTEIDRFLTGAGMGAFAKNPDASKHGAEQDIKSFLEEFKQSKPFLSLVIYLGDGGLSRLLVSTNRASQLAIELSDSSSAKAKELWKNLLLM